MVNYYQIQMLNQKEEKRQLVRQNQELKRQLQKSKALIERLYSQIAELKEQLLQYSQHQSSKTPQTPQTPKTPKMMVEETFDYSSSSQPDREVLFSQGDQQRKSNQKVKFKQQILSQSTSQGRMNHIELRKAKTIILHSEEVVQRKSIQKVLKKSSERKKQLDNTIERQDSIRALSTKQISSPLPMFSRQFSVAKSQKQILFKKTSNSKPIFQHFFVTGMTKDGPCVTYHYPRDQDHDFSGYLALIYGQNYLKLPDLSPCNSRNRLNTNLMYRQNSQSNKRQCFVIPILKSKSQTAERDYLILCQNQQLVLEKVDKESNNYYFSRYYCFLTQWKFFAEFRKLGTSLIDRMQSRKNNRQYNNQIACGIQVGKQFEQSLSFLHQKSTDYNKTIDCCIGESGLRFSADVPPLQSSYQLVDKYLQNHLFNICVCVKISEEEVVQTKLFGILLSYALAQIKLLLYSNSKTKISECILELLQLIKPLVYVNPIIVSSIKQEHQNYLDAPMGLILGLWNQSRKNNRQKIQIFMNKKLNLAGQIEKAKLNITDGVVINLDTGLIFGGSVDPQLTAIGVKLNNIALTTKNSKNLRDYYKLTQRLLSGRIESEEGRSAWNSLLNYIRKTQLYCYYLQNKEDLS